MSRCPDSSKEIWGGELIKSVCRLAWRRWMNVVWKGVNVKYRTKKGKTEITSPVSNGSSFNEDLMRS